MASSAVNALSSFSCSGPPFHSSPNPNPSNNLLDDSFSAYLALIRQSFSADLAANPNYTSFQAIAAPPRRLSEDNGELDVFSADKYFSGALDARHHHGGVASATTTTKSSSSNCKKKKSSNCSETSASSRSINLLRDGKRAPNRLFKVRSSSIDGDGPPRRRRRSVFDFFGCSCLRKNSVKAEEVEDEEEDVVPRRQRRSNLRSESSSELFEIDSVSMKSSSQPAGYEPSEASIEWSVGTRSAANWSVGSETTSMTYSRRPRRRRASTSEILGLGCVSEKAVTAVSVKEDNKVGISLERYHVIMGRPRRASL